jgi:hypothetical protein
LDDEELSAGNYLCDEIDKVAASSSKAAAGLM